MKYKRYFRKTSLKQKGVGEFFLEEVKLKRPKNFLEIGVFHGVTARNVCELLYKIHKDKFKIDNNFLDFDVDQIGEQINIYDDRVYKNRKNKEELVEILIQAEKSN